MHFTRFVLRWLLLTLASGTMACAQNVTTYRYDNQVSGINPRETLLTPANVNVATFGELFSDPVEGQAYAQPLYLSNLVIPGKGTRNVVYIATCHDMVYAFDADAGGDPLWVTSFISPEKHITPVPQPDVISGDTSPEIGILGTPVIDAATGTLYVIAKTKETGRGDNHSHYVQKLHALDVATGAEKFGGPGIIGDTTCDDAANRETKDYDCNLAVAPNTPSVKGSSSEAVNGVVYFNALRTNQRPSLTLAGGIIFVAWASHGDNRPYHGWVVGFDAKTLAPAPNCIWCVTPDGEEGGIWQSGCGPAIDQGNHLYVSTANGTFDAVKGGRDYSQSLLKFFLASGLSVAKSAAGADQTFDYFSPHDEQNLSNGDVDLGSGGMLPFDVPEGPVPHLVIGSGKEGVYYVLNSDNLGQFDATTDHVVQKFEKPDRHEIMATPIFFNHTLFYNRSGEDLRARAFTNGQFSDAYNHTADSFNGRGGGPVLTANGTKDAIIWMLNNGGPAEVKAYSVDALAAAPANTSVPALYVGRLQDGGIKFTHPLVINGKVYALGASRRGNRISSAHLCVFGLLPSSIGSAKPEAPTHLQATSSSPGTITLFWVTHDPGVTGFLIERSGVVADAFVQIGTAGNTATSFADNTVTGATAYKYRVTAVNKNGPSDPSAAIDAKSHDYISEEGLTAYWTFDEDNGATVHDLTGHGHDGTIVGEVSWSQGAFDSPGLEFHGTGNARSRVEVKESADLEFPAEKNFSVSFWARPSSLPGHWAGAVTKSRGMPTGWFGVYISPDNHWAFRGPDETKNISGGPVIANSWQHVVAVQDSGTRTLYVDGVKVASAASAQAADGNGPLWIGQADADEEAFAGNLDEVRVYDRALGEADVLRLYGDYLPAIHLTAPADNSTVTGKAEIQFTAMATTSAPDTAIDNVRFFEGQKQIGDAGGNPVNWTWRDVPAGDHTVTARVVDTNGNSVEAPSVHVKVAP